MGDDRYSWAVFLDGRPVVMGQAKAQVKYYKAHVRKANGIVESDDRKSRRVT